MHPAPALDVVPILAAALVNIVVGFVWYAPPVLGNAWLKELGKKQEELGSPGPAYALVVVSALVSALALNYVIHGISGASPTLQDGALVGLIVGVGFAATAMGAESIFGGKSLKLYLINAGYHVVALALAGVVVTFL
ncbi:MAG TPA: DUF1761 domain-containing protein [Candidatus Thermoplasmatota archaeon]|nr:DUF1761 domain-containing protein [Candidatus Thermoplasmatota archaeon]